MKAMVLERPNLMALKMVEDLHPKVGEVLIKTTHAGICGTDTKIYEGKIPANYPLVMGHEIVGEVIDGDTNGFAKPGARVLVDPVLYCGTCFHCKQGDTNLCPNGGIMGREVNGGFADYCIAKTSHIYPIPDELDSKTGAAIQVLTTVLHAQNKGNLANGDAVIVSGLGVTGLMHIQLAKARGAKVVVGTSRNAHKREMALALGADYAVGHGEEAKKTILEATKGIGADMVIECVGNLSMLAEAVDLVRLGGKIVPFGIYPSGQAELPFYDFYFKELQIINVRAAKGHDFSACIDLVSRGEVDLAPLITHTLPYTELNSAIRMLMEPSDERIKVILEAA